MTSWKSIAVDKVEREHLKHDRFAEEVTHSVEFVAGHKKQFGLYAGIAVAAVVIGFGVWFYMGKEAEARQEALKVALQTQDAAIGPGSNPYVKSFPTQAEKDAAAQKAFTDLASRYPGKEVGAIATYYLGILAADGGKYSEAEKHFQVAADSGQTEYAALAKFSLAQMYAKQNKKAEAEKILRALADSPTMFISKPQAQIELAKVIAQSKPDEAKKLLEPLRISPRSTVSRWAVTAYGDAKLK